MRTKTTLAAAAILAAGLASSLAQANVYSLNVVGYVNKTYQADQFNLIVNPLSNGDNSLNTIFTALPDNSQLFTWDPNTVDLVNPGKTFIAGPPAHWDVNQVLNAGQAYFLYTATPGPVTVTYVGDVRQGALSTPIVGPDKFNMIGSQVPQAGDIATILPGFPAGDNDNIQKWDPATAGFFLNSATYVAGPNTWVWDPPIRTFDVAEGLLYYRATAGAANYVRNFTVQ